MNSQIDAEKGTTYSPVNLPKSGRVKTSIVEFEGPNDPADPLNWTLKRKVITTFLYGMTTLGGTWASSIYTTATSAIAEEFEVSSEVSTIGLTIFLFG